MKYYFIKSTALDFIGFSISATEILITVPLLAVCSKHDIAN